MYHVFMIICTLFALLMVVDIALKASKRNEKLHDLESKVHGMSYEVQQLHADHNKSVAQMVASLEDLKKILTENADREHEDLKAVNRNLVTTEGLVSKTYDMVVGVDGNTRKLFLTLNNLYDQEKHAAMVSGFGTPTMSEEEVAELRTKFIMMDELCTVEARGRIEERNAQMAAEAEQQELENLNPEEPADEQPSPTPEDLEKDDEPAPEEKTTAETEAKEEEKTGGFRTIEEKWLAMKKRKDEGASLKELAKEFGYRDKSSALRFLKRGEAKYGKRQ